MEYFLLFNEFFFSLWYIQAEHGSVVLKMCILVFCSLDDPSSHFDYNNNKQMTRTFTWVDGVW